MAEAKQEGKKKEKIPTAKKRDKQNLKRQLRNRQMKSRISTAIKALNTGIATKEDSSSLADKLNAAVALLDKGTKNGLVHRNKAARLKSRLTKKSLPARS